MAIPSHILFHLPHFLSALWNNWSEPFECLGSLLTIKNPLLGIIRDMAAQKLSNKAVQSLKSPPKLKEIQDCRVWWHHAINIFSVALGAASKGLHLGLGNISCMKWRCREFWLSVLFRMSPRVDLADQTECFFSLPNKCHSQSYIWLIRTFPGNKGVLFGKGENSYIGD